MGKSRVETGRGPGRAGEVKRGATTGSSVRKAKQGQGGKFAVLLAVILLVGAAALGYAYQSSKKKITTVDPNLPPLAAKGYVEGDSTAPLQVLEFGDFECPQCGQFAVVTAPDIRKQLIETGKISLRYFDYPLPMHR